MRRSVYDILRPPAFVVDVAIVVVLALPVLVLQLSLPVETPISTESSYAFYSLVLLAPLAFRRVLPVASFAAYALLCLIQYQNLELPIWGDIGIFLAVATIAQYGPNWARWGGLATGLLGAVLGPVQWVGGWQTIQTRSDLYPIALVAISIIASWILGDLRRTRARYVAELEDRAERLTKERDQQVELAAAAERQRIAREMHDVVAHNLSVIVVQADGGRYAAEHDPAAATGALETIAATGRGALTDMRRLLGVLRTGDSVEFVPQPDAEQVDALVDRVAGSGLDVSLQVEGRPRTLDASTSLSIYRIVQESLTNTMKHGGPGVHVEVRLTWSDSDVTVSVVDDGRGAAADAPSGPAHGIVGMRERVELHGGTLVARPAAGGGFEVVARLPYVEEGSRA